MAQIRVCDVCEEKPAKTLNIPYERKMSPAGDSETNYENFDLCIDCLFSVVQRFVSDKASDFSINRKLIDKIKEKVGPKAN